MTARSRLVPAAILAAPILAAGLTLIGQGAAIHAKAILAQALLERAFAETVATGRPAKPWSWADTWPVARIEVPRLEASAVVLAGSSGQALAFGPAQLEGTPDAGDLGTAVFAAHRDTHFSFLGAVRTGDDLVVTRKDGRRIRFAVTGTRVVRFDDPGIDVTADGRFLVLATCWPLGARAPGPLRYLVLAEAVGDVATARTASEEGSQF